jgi:hypothetical protein
MKMINPYEEFIELGLKEEHLKKFLSQFKGNIDMRYKIPKTQPKTPQDTVDRTIVENEIYRKAKVSILNAQRKQVGYGLDKYPEPLNSNTWDTIETIDHIIEESIDKLHYLVMLRIKLEQEMISKNEEKSVKKHNDHCDAFTYSFLAGSDFDGEYIQGDEEDE